ncbi:hypothetical protein [Candidatus Epulonipiscium viviparus]|uniref:hypothetical protein n=1 Tax=Candidatus Epulonipiscium viviparus TaxID=420336 RepID=UPI00016C0EBF|nr:hypothetical protein [Candidatus Epulopiscium viviparus]
MDKQDNMLIELYGVEKATAARVEIIEKVQENMGQKIDDIHETIVILGESFTHIVKDVGNFKERFSQIDNRPQEMLENVKEHAVKYIVAGLLGGITILISSMITLYFGTV